MYIDFLFFFFFNIISYTWTMNTLGEIRQKGLVKMNYVALNFSFFY